MSGTLAGPWLSAIRQVSDAKSRSDPHITVRYPIDRIAREIIRTDAPLALEAIDITGPGTFGGSDRKVLFLSCHSESLEAVRYKPQFPDSIFHLTLYEGPATDFALQLEQALNEFPWQLVVRVPSGTKLVEIPVGPGARTKRADRFTPEALSALSQLDRRITTSRDVEGLDDAGRMQLVRASLEKLHEILEVRVADTYTARLRKLNSVRSAKPNRLWTSSPVPLAKDANRDQFDLSAEQARTGNLVLTPPELVKDIVEYSLDVHGDKPIRFGDPAFGSGIFFAVVNRLVPKTRVADATVVELNDQRAAFAANLWKARGLEVLNGNFLTAMPETQWTFVLANPPYVRSQQLEDELKTVSADLIRDSIGIQVPKRANLFVYFVLSAHRWLAPGATAAWLLPADFMETTYAQVLRDYLTDRVQLVRVHSYDPTEMRFENVRVAASVIIFKNEPPDQDKPALLSRGGNLAVPAESHWVSAEQLSRSRNWRRVSSGIHVDSSSTSPTLSDVFRIRRGIATGANRFFVLSKEEVENLGIEKHELTPLLPRPRFMPQDGVVKRHRDGSPANNKAPFLIDSDEELKVLSERAPNLARYLKEAPRDVTGGVLVSRRRPFYKQESRAVPQLVASPMGHFGASSSPVRFFVNQSNAKVLNNYLALYSRYRTSGSFTRQEAMRLFEILQSIDPNEYRIWGREYSGGMFKLEPRALGKVRLPCSWSEIENVLGPNPDELPFKR